MAISKQGIWTDKNFSSSIINQYDTNTYVEPDGSVWIRIFHHNDPTNKGLFNQTDTFDKSVYLDENKWFNIALCNLVSNKWELMVKQKRTIDYVEEKFRWIQNANPMTANYAQAQESAITKIATSSYNAFSDFGGLFKVNNRTYLCNARTSNSTNWFGAMGCWSVFQTGIPSYNSASAAITTGYMDLYLRVDNYNTPNYRISKGGVMANDFYEI